jgi:hypothetical protein
MRFSNPARAIVSRTPFSTVESTQECVLDDASQRADGEGVFDAAADAEKF